MLFPLLRWLVLQYEAHWPTSEAHRNRSVSRGGCLLLRLFGLSSHSCPEPLPVWRLMVYWMLCVFGRTKRGGLGLKKKNVFLLTLSTWLVFHWELVDSVGTLMFTPVLCFICCRNWWVLTDAVIAIETWYTCCCDKTLWICLSPNKLVPVRITPLGLWGNNSGWFSARSSH